MSQKQFLKELQERLPLPAYYLYSKDPYLLKDASRTISSLIPEQRRDFSFIVFDMAPSSTEPPEMSSVIDVLNTPGFFGEKKTVVLENVHTLKKKEYSQLSAYLKNPSTEVLLVMMSLKPTGAELKEKLKAVRVISIDMNTQELTDWLLRIYRERGIEVTVGAINLLIATVGHDAGRLISETDKISLLGKTRIDEKDVGEMFYGSSQFNVFSLADAIISKDKKRVFKIYRAISESIDSFSMVGVINWKFGELYMKGRHRKGWFKEAFGLLSEADRKIKSSGGSYPLEDLLIRLLQI